MAIKNWQIVGMLLLHSSHVHEFVTRVLKHYERTVEFKGPWFTGMDFMITSDTMNIHYICSKNFSNYPKGSKFREIFEPLGDGIFTSDNDSWRNQRKLLHSLIRQSKFQLYFEEAIKGKVERSLIPVLDHVSSLGIEVDLQVVFQRLTFGMLPGLLLHASHVHEFGTRVLKHYEGTVEFKGPWFTGMDFMITSDPMNIHYICSKNFSNYPKGSKFGEIFEPLGDGIFTSDNDSWRNQRKLLHSLIRQSKFQLYFEEAIKGKVERSLIPVLDHVSSLGIEVDLQDVFQRLTFDTACLTVVGYDPNSLSINFPGVEFLKGFDEVEECLLYRHLVPQRCWKLQRWLRIGTEKKLLSACKIFEQHLYERISSKREELAQKKEEAEFATAANLISAGRDTVSAGLTWLFWLVATHPSVEAKILEEIKEHLVDNDNRWRVLDINVLSKLVYLHGAICESLRLFPPVPFEHRCAAKNDVLPSGHCINPNTRMLYSLYSMGRMEGIWGRDCLEFKPERWISERGRIVHVPSFNFIAFNAGARICLGKETSFIQMKIIASAIIWNYRVQIVEGHLVSPSISIILHMKHGLKVRINKRYV